jgi:hypothetical protein
MLYALRPQEMSKQQCSVAATSSWEIGKDRIVSELLASLNCGAKFRREPA